MGRKRVPQEGPQDPLSMEDVEELMKMLGVPNDEMPSGRGLPSTETSAEGAQGLSTPTDASDRVRSDDRGSGLSVQDLAKVKLKSVLEAQRAIEDPNSKYGQKILHPDVPLTRTDCVQLDAVMKRGWIMPENYRAVIPDKLMTMLQSKNDRVNIRAAQLLATLHQQNIDLEKIRKPAAMTVRAENAQFNVGCNQSRTTAEGPSDEDLLQELEAELE